MQNYELFCVFILQYKNDIYSEGDLRKDRRGHEILYLVIKKYVSFWEILAYFNLLGNLSHTSQWSLFPLMKVDPYKHTIFFFWAE